MIVCSNHIHNEVSRLKVSPRVTISNGEGRANCASSVGFGKLKVHNRSRLMALMR